VFERAEQVANAVLYEGYVLYPYRASAKKNRARWQWGVIAPKAHHDAVGSDPFQMQTEILVEACDDARLHVRVRFLQVQARTIEKNGQPVAEAEVDGELLLTWDEGVEQQVDTEIALSDLPAEVPIEIVGGRDVEQVSAGAGDDVRIVRERLPLSARLLLDQQVLPGPYGVRKLRARIENVTPWAVPTEDREEATRRALVATHTLIAVEPGRFVSLLDPPEWAAPYAKLCENLHTYPVLIGDDVLSSPIILYDQAEIAPESPGDLFDALEIDEILTLRTMALTEDEKREARATDPRARAIVERTDAMPQDVLDRLHGAIRSVRPVRIDQPPTLESSAEDGRTVPWWDPGMDASVSPTTDRVWVGRVSVGRGSRVRLRPGAQRADAQDMFLQGRTGTVEAVLFSVDGDTYLAVTLDDDPEAADVQRWHGRYLYFSPDEVEAL
jgi:hypothetical protein